MRFPMLISSLLGANPRLSEHKIGVFVLFWPSRPLFSGFSSTKSACLCSRGGECGIVKRNRGDAYHFTAAPTPSHQRTRPPAPAHQHPHTSTSAPAPAHPPSNGPQQWHQAPSSAVWRSSAIWRRVMPSGTVLAPCSAVLAPSSAVQVPCNAGWVPEWCRYGRALD